MSLFGFVNIKIQKFYRCTFYSTVQLLSAIQLYNYVIMYRIYSYTVYSYTIKYTVIRVIQLYNKLYSYTVYMLAIRYSVQVWCADTKLYTVVSQWCART